MPVSPDELFAFFDQLGIAHQTTPHRPLFTVADGVDLHDSLPGLHCKNLFLKDKKGQLWLVVMPGDKRADLASLAEKTGAVKFSFGKPDLLQEILGIPPGSVTPFALMNDTQKAVKVVLDCDMMAAELVSYHPLHNAASTAIASRDLSKFLRALGYEPLMIDCGISQE